MAYPDLKDQVVLITGASSGIGWATALEFAKHGSRLALVARREDKLAELSGLLRPAETLALPADVADPAAARAAVEKTLARFGRIDVLVNNAGVMATRRFHEQDSEELDAVMRTNYAGPAVLIRTALPAMLERGRGHVVNVSSLAGLLGMPYMASYCASKFALVGLTEALRREYYGTGVTFTSLCPGSVRTPMSIASLKDSKLSRFALPKTAEQVARKIVSAARRRPPEVIFGDAPACVVRLAQRSPRLADWVIHQVMSRAHPLGRRRA